MINVSEINLLPTCLAVTPYPSLLNLLNLARPEHCTTHLRVINRLPLLSAIMYLFTLHSAGRVSFRLANILGLRPNVCAMTLTSAFFTSLYHL